MKKILLIIVVAFSLVSCENFLDRYPKGYYHQGNYTSDSLLNPTILTEAKLAEAYANLRSYDYFFAGFGMCNYTTPDVEKGSTPSDGQQIVEFKPMSYTASNNQIANFYSTCYNGIYKANEAVALANTIEDDESAKEVYIAEALFIRGLLFYRLNQAFGGVTYVNRVMEQDENTEPRSTVDEVWTYIQQDLTYAIPLLPSRRDRIATGTTGRATQNAARAVLAKSYMYQKNWSQALAVCNEIIKSGDNDLTTPYAEMFYEVNEFGPESVLEVFCDEKPSENIYMGSQFSQIQGIRGIPNLGWGFNAPSQLLMDSYEEGDPRKEASVIASGDVLDGVTVRADQAGYQYFNKKAYCPASERGIYGRPSDGQGQWTNVRVIRYADVVLMYAECALETGNIDEALDKLNMVRERARGGNTSVLPDITTRDVAELRAKIHFERRIELAMEFERFYDLVRWGEADSTISNFVAGKHELFPIPQTEIDKSNKVLTQNPGY